MAEPAASRRRTLRTLIASLLGGAALWRFFTPASPEGASTTAVSVRETDVPVRGALVLPEERVAIVNDGRSLLALDLTCTHLGCTVKGTAFGFACPCHGSRFTSAGEVTKGPATRALRRLALVREAGMIRVSRGKA
jgi:nitrite reductase/ring-hydroxylating ferredoxin subunit